jgi:hypothetical protein
MGGSCYDRIGPLAFCGFVVNESLVFLFLGRFFGIVRKSRAPCLKKNAVFLIYTAIFAKKRCLLIFYGSRWPKTNAVILSFFYSRVAGTKQQAGARPKKTLSS